MARDDFSQAVKETLGKRVAYRCSNPSCVAQTTGPHSEADRFVNLGVASHITAASPGGPRYDTTFTPSQRSSIENAVWLCQRCAKLVDNDALKYTVDVLAGWKVTAEAKAMRSLFSNPDTEYLPQPVSAKHVPIPIIGGLAYDEARSHLLKAGWQPHMNHWSQASKFDMQYGNGLHFWNKGYHEIRQAMGTGMSLCSFAFEDVYGHKLIVVTAGEVIEEINATAHVWRWYFESNEQER
jgi:hypothetical protein